MNDIRPMIESILMDRISAAMRTLPDRGRRASEERAAAVKCATDSFVADVNRIVESEFHRYCHYDSRADRL